LIRVWRLSSAAYVDRILSGGGAYRHGGRWNSPGRAVVYMSECLSLCALEILAHMVKLHMIQGGKCVWVDIPEAMVTPLSVDDLSEDWKAVPAPPGTKQIGDRWFDDRVSPVLKVPSTVIPIEHNFVLNPAHPNFRALHVGEIRDFEFDERLFSQEGRKRRRL
jgi:RES domain-containing protein